MIYDFNEEEIRILNDKINTLLMIKTFIDYGYDYTGIYIRLNDPQDGYNYFDLVGELSTTLSPIVGEYGFVDHVGNHLEFLKENNIEIPYDLDEYSYCERTNNLDDVPTIGFIIKFDNYNILNCIKNSGTERPLDKKVSYFNYDCICTDRSINKMQTIYKEDAFYIIYPDTDNLYWEVLNDMVNFIEYVHCMNDMNEKN